MAEELRWEDAEDIGLKLADMYPEQNPLEVRFTDLHKLITGLPTFVDDPRSRQKASSKPSKWHGTRNIRTVRSKRC